MTNAAAFRATYSDFRLVRSRKVVQLVFEVPLEKTADALACLGGMPNPAAEVWCGIARLDPTKIHDGGAPVPAPLTADCVASASASRRGEPSPNRFAQRAGILCNDPLFWRYLSERGHGQVNDKDAAAVVVRVLCNVLSRSEIKPGTEAATRLDLLESGFICWRDVPELADA